MARVQQEAPPAGSAIVNVAWAGTGVFAALSIAATVFPDQLGTVSAGVSIAMFVAGCGCFLWAYALGVSRSREEVVSLAGLFFLAGTAPPDVAFRLRLALAAQVVVAVVTAAVRLYSELAFGVLAPLWGLGLMSLWGALHGRFPPRDTAA